MSSSIDLAMGLDFIHDEPVSADSNERLFVQLQKVLMENRFLKQENKMLKDLIRIDPLTELYNRQFMDEYLFQEIDRAERYESHFSMIIVDIDFFKRFNDNYGHQVGDTVLKQVAQILKRGCRISDKIFRYGGEEFLIALPETDLDGAYAVASKIRKMVEREPIPGVAENVTVSIGVSERKEDCTLDKLIHSADTALYEAKKNGRNQVRKVA